VLKEISLTAWIFWGMSITHSEVKPIRNLGPRNDLMGTAESISALDKPRASRAPLEGGGAHTIGATEDVHANDERNLRLHFLGLKQPRAPVKTVSVVILFLRQESTSRYGSRAARLDYFRFAYALFKMQN
jgi:hypothetical protein